MGRGNIIRVAQLCIGKKLIDGPIQQLYSLKLPCECITTTNEDEKKSKLNPSACSKRTAAETAKWWLKDFAIQEDDGELW